MKINLKIINTQKIKIKNKKNIEIEFAKVEEEKRNKKVRTCEVKKIILMKTNIFNNFSV